MDVNELRKKRQKLENDILSSVSMLVEKFKVDTGFSPSQINIGLISETRIGDSEPQLFVVGCDVDIAI